MFLYCVAFYVNTRLDRSLSPSLGGAGPRAPRRARWCAVRRAAAAPRRRRRLAATRARHPRVVSATRSRNIGYGHALRPEYVPDAARPRRRGVRTPGCSPPARQTRCSASGRCPCSPSSARNGASRSSARPSPARLRAPWRSALQELEEARPRPARRAAHPAADDVVSPLRTRTTGSRPHWRARPGRRPRRAPRRRSAGRACRAARPARAPARSRGRCRRSVPRRCRRRRLQSRAPRRRPAC